jgi:hypothetical protein
MRSKLLGLGLGLTLSTLGVVAIPTTAFAAGTTCYTTCNSPTQGSNPPVLPQTVVTPPAPVQSVNSGGLALTGGDIEGMVAVGAGALVVGGLLVRRSRRQLQATA